MDRQKANRKGSAVMIKMSCILFCIVAIWIYEAVKKNIKLNTIAVYFIVLKYNTTKTCGLKLTVQEWFAKVMFLNWGGRYALDSINHLIFKFSITAEK